MLIWRDSWSSFLRSVKGKDNNKKARIQILAFLLSHNETIVGRFFHYLKDVPYFE